MNISALFKDQHGQKAAEVSVTSAEDKFANMFAKSTQNSSISQLFTPASTLASGPTHLLTKAQIISLFSLQPDSGLIQAEAKAANVFNEDSLLPLSLEDKKSTEELVMYSGSFKNSAKVPGAHERTKREDRGKIRRHGSQEENIENVNENIAVLFGKAGTVRKTSEGGDNLLSKLNLKEHNKPEGADIHELFKTSAAVPTQQVEVQQTSVKSVAELEPKKSDNPFAEWGKNSKEEEKVWYYKDLRGDIQGPFSAAEMNVWNKAGYFAKTLPVSYKDKVVFVSLETVVSSAGGKKSAESAGNKDTMKIEVSDLFGIQSKGIEDLVISSKEHKEENKPKEKSKFDALFE